MHLKNLPAEHRPREKLLNLGAAALSDAELLALLLRTGIPGKNVVALAEELLDQKNGFGGIAKLLGASPASLRLVKGLGPAKQAELLAILELAKRALAEQLRQRAAFESPSAVKHYLQLHLADKTHEVFAIMFLDSQHRLVAFEEMFQGTINQTSVYPREVLKRALHHHASAVVLAHNHPSGRVVASSADEHLTHTLKAALAMVDIKVLDHIIVGPGQSTSMAESGLL
jgi:DNA repair protein RadC